MEYQSHATSQFESLPTFLKWLKGQKDDVQGKMQLVTKIWFPSKFSNFTLDTESYRLRVPFTDDDRIELTDMFEQSIESEEVLAIRVDDKGKATFTIITLPNERGTWEELGSTGYRCTVQERKGGGKRTSKKLVGNVTPKDAPPPL